MKPVEQIQVHFIVDGLRKGVQRAKILAAFGVKWRGISPRTFDRRYSKAEIEFAGESKRVKDIAEQEVKEEAKGLKSKIMGSLERQAVLSSIAAGELEVQKLIVTKDGIKKAKCKPDHTDIRNAIAELNKMDGAYAAEKRDITVNDLTSIIIEPVSPNKDK